MKRIASFRTMKKRKNRLTRLIMLTYKRLPRGREYENNTEHAKILKVRRQVIVLPYRERWWHIFSTPPKVIRYDQAVERGLTQ